MSRHQIAISLNSRPSPSAGISPITGRVTVTAATDTTCRKIVLRWACRLVR